MSPSEPPLEPRAPDHTVVHLELAFLVAIDAAPEAEASTYHDHLARCAACQASYFEALTIAGELGALASERDASPPFRERLMNIIRQESGQLSHRPPPRCSHCPPTSSNPTRN